MLNHSHKKRKVFLFLMTMVKFKVMLAEAYLEPSRISAMELFSLWLRHILKTYLIQSNCLLGFIFYTIHPFMKNFQL